MEAAPPQWRFDTPAGIAAVWAARCEANEAAATEFLLECIAAQEEYRRLGVGGPGAFALRFRSQPGNRDGLWWPDELAPPLSPLGPMVDEAFIGADPPIDPWTVDSYRGYRYRILDRAGAAAPGGAARWLSPDGQLTGGFAFLAWPVEHGRTGVHTLLVAMDGTVWIQDLGPSTETAAAAIRSLDPGTGWTMVLPAGN